MKRRKRAERTESSFVPCGRCFKGLLRINRDGHTLMTLCQCWIDHKAGRRHQPAALPLDFEAKASGDDLVA
jgi:hypothetical protein